MISTLIFDLGNVLLFFDHELAYTALAKLYDRPREAIRATLAENGLQLDYEKGLISTAGLHAHLAHWSGQTQVSVAAMAFAASNIFRPNSEMIDLVKQAKQRGLRLVLLSNTNDAHFEFIRQRYEFISEFDELVLSYQVKALKPEAAIFHAAIAAARCSPQECFYTDDIGTYVEAAATHGIRGTTFVSSTAYLSELNATAGLRLR